MGTGYPTLSGREYPYKPPAPAATAPVPGDAAAAQTEDDAQPAPPPSAMAALDKLAEEVEQSGVRSVTGDVVGDDSFFLDEPYGPSWGWDNLQWDYGAPVSALSFNDNVTKLYIHEGRGAAGRDGGRVDAELGLLFRGKQHDAGCHRRNAASWTGAQARLIAGAGLGHGGRKRIAREHGDRGSGDLCRRCV